jgi:gamma-glutamylcyclotransferase (GGCT)/AIG2-like uncharacterized protein YtfP
VQGTSGGRTKFLFVYGTLMRGESRAVTVGGGTYLRDGRVQDLCLYDLGDYPGVYPTPGGQVFGEIFVFEDIALALSRPDVLEDVPSLFRREVLPVRSGSNHLEAWIYVLQKDPGGRFPLISGGRWPAHRLSNTPENTS